MLLDMASSTKPIVTVTNGRMTTTFAEIEVGQRGWVTRRGKRQLIKKTEWDKSGSHALNAIALTGRKGRVFVWSDSVVEVVND